MSVFNRNNVDFKKQPMFFGEELNTQRFDEFKYPVFDSLTQRQLSYFWRPEEVSLQKDRNDYQALNESQKHIFTSNLKYQILLDSVQGRGPALALLPHVSLPELESCIVAWDFMETIHSRSYTYMIKNLYSDPAEVFDHIINEDAIIKRAESVTKYYDDFIEYAIQEDFELKQSYNMKHISLMCLFSKLNEQCVMKYSEDRPMEAKYTLDNESYVVFYLAPKIED